MPEPENKESFEKRSLENLKVSGYGVNTKTHFPCPACGAPDWLIMPISDGMNNYEVLRKGATCIECERTFKFIVRRDASNVSSECVQTGGLDLPFWHEYKPRRI